MLVSKATSVAIIEHWSLQSSDFWCWIVVQGVRQGGGENESRSWHQLS